MYVCFFFFNDTATTEIYTLSLHDALPISPSNSGSSRLVSRTSSGRPLPSSAVTRSPYRPYRRPTRTHAALMRSEEHTSELQSRQYLVCRLLLEKKKNNKYETTIIHIYSFI